MKEVYVVSGARTPIGKLLGMLSKLSPVELGAHVVKGALIKGSVPFEAVDMVVMGNVLRAGHGQDLARQISIRAGIRPEVDAYSVDMVCSSGMMSFINAVQQIKGDDSQVVVAGGTESMSNAPFVTDSMPRYGVKFARGGLRLSDSLLIDGLTDPFNQKLMGEEADMVARKFDISRKELDEVSYESHRRAAYATDNGKFKEEILPIQLGGISLDKDEGIRRDTTMEKLSRLPPAFGPEGLHTAGSSSQMSDGAAALVLASGDAVKRYKLEPIAKVLGYSWTGIESWRFTEAPIIAIKKLLSKLDMNLSQFDFFENNEAFAVSSVLFNKLLEVPYEVLDVYGGAIALGHPIGASGSRIIVTLLNVLKERGGRRGIASLCHGIGGATAVALELV
jgi:acetyl-CoA C-acetyltransferase